MTMRLFTCAECETTFQATNTPSDKEAESARLYAAEPLADGDEFVSVCDTCWTATLKRIAAQPERPAAKEAFRILRGLT